MTVADLGAFVLAQVVVAFCVMVGDFALQSTALIRFLAVATTIEERRRIAGTGLVWKVVIAVPMSALILAAGPTVASLLATPLLVPLSRYAALLFIFTSLDDGLTAILQGLHRYSRIAVITTIGALLRLGLTVYLVALLNRGVWGLAQAFVAAAACSVCLRLIAVADTLQWGITGPTLGSMWRFGLPLAGNGALTFAFTRVDRVVLGALSGPAGVALYDVASRLPESLQRIYDAFRAIFLPFLASLIGRGERLAASHFVNTANRVVSLCMALLALAVIAFQTEIVRLLFSAQYVSAGPVLGLLMVSLSVALVTNLFGTSLVAAGRSDAPLKINCVMTAVSLVGNLFFVPIWGPLGAALAALTANVITNLAASVWFRTRTEFQLPTRWAFTVGGGLALFWVVLLLRSGGPPLIRLLTGLACLALPATGLVILQRRPCLAAGSNGPG